MIKLISHIAVGTFFFSVSAQAFTAYEIAALVHRQAPEGTFVDYEADLFPTEKEIESFPEPLDPKESNPEILEEYYRNVATTYRTWGEEKFQEAQKLETLVRQQTQKLYLSKFRDKGQKRHIITHAPFEATAQMHQARYARDHANMCHIQASESLKKADFYEAMAETCAEISKEL